MRTSDRECLPPRSYGEAPEDKRKECVFNLNKRKKKSVNTKIMKKVNVGKFLHLYCVCTWSSMALVCAADTQKRALASVIGVAGKPTTTTPIFLCSISREKALCRDRKTQTTSSFYIEDKRL